MQRMRAAAEVLVFLSRFLLEETSRLHGVPEFSRLSNAREGILYIISALIGIA